MSNRAREEIFLAFLRWGFDAKGWAEETRRKYATRCRAADAWLVEHRSTSLVWAKPVDLRAYLFSTTQTARYRNGVRQSLVGFFEYLIDTEVRIDNPAIGLPRLKEPRGLPKALEIEQGAQLLATAKAIGPRALALVSLFLYEGIRNREARTLEWSNVELDAGWISFTGKGSKARRLPLHPETIVHLRQWRRQCEGARWVFPSTRHPHKPMSETYLYMLVRDIGEMAGVKLYPHLMRHTAATALLEQTGDLRTVQEYLGHSDPKTTAIYLKVRPSRLKEAVRLLDYTGATSTSRPEASDTA